jgi:hypothetical protein
LQVLQVLQQSFERRRRTTRRVWQQLLVTGAAQQVPQLATGATAAVQPQSWATGAAQPQAGVAGAAVVIVYMPPQPQPLIGAAMTFWLTTETSIDCTAMPSAGIAMVAGAAVAVTSLGETWASWANEQTDSSATAKNEKTLVISDSPKSWN